MSEDIGLGDEPLYILEAFRRLEVRREAFFVSIDGMKEQGVAVDPEVLDGEAAAGVAGAGSFYLYHTGAEVGQPETGRGSGEILAELQYGEPV